MATPLIVLMAEDNEHDVIATRRAWKNRNIANPLYVVTDGEQCLDYLFQRNKFAEPGAAPRPGVLLLDINMPRVNGLEVLEELRRTAQFELLPVVMLTTSSVSTDVFRAYELGANAYIVKPVGFDNFAEAISRINLFWEMVQRAEA